MNKKLKQIGIPFILMLIFNLGINVICDIEACVPKNFQQSLIFENANTSVPSSDL